MTEITSLRDIPQKNIFRKGDTFVLFGELFGRGYVNGLLDEARKAGMNIVGMTVGRRDENMALRPLNAEELAEAEANLGGRIINVPLMAGFDLDAPAVLDFSQVCHLHNPLCPARAGGRAGFGRDGIVINGGKWR